VIAEAVELAGLFGAEGAPRFVNGVLGALADNLDPIRQMFTAEPPETGE
jgi:N utilization substance protein B